MPLVVFAGAIEMKYTPYYKGGQDQTMEQEKTERKPRPKIPPKERMALGINDAANVLGVCPNTIRNLIKGDKLPSVKVGRLRMVRTADLQKLLGMVA